MIRRLLSVMVFCFGTSFGQQQERIRAPFFQGDKLPTPPQQHAPWSCGVDALSNAAETLFEQGLADPRGLEYREIEIAIGEPWHGGGYPVKTHGWVLPQKDEDVQFAVAWNGLVYPLVSVGDAADLHSDCTLASTNTRPLVRSFGETSEDVSVRPAPPSALKVVLLLRLGEKQAAARITKLFFPVEPGDPYLDVARDWTWFTFERAVCAHERGDDRLALVDARMLTRVQPLVEAEATRRGFEREPDYSNSRFSGRKLPFLPFLTQLPVLLADSERRVADQKNPPETKSGISRLIDDLQNVNARQYGQPGGVSLAQDPRVQALVNCGDRAVEPLLDTMEKDPRLTRSVSFGRDFFRSRHLLPVSQAAQAALVDLLRVKFSSVGEYRTYWQQMGSLPLVERFYATLNDKNAGPDQWVGAAGNIVQPTDVEVHGGWTTVPNRKPGQAITLRGESLRDGRTPSVSELMAQRSDDIAAIHTGSTRDHFLYLDAGRIALSLAVWDSAAAIPVLKKRLLRAWRIGEETGDILAFNGNPASHFGRMIAKMTVAWANCGDLSAFDEYASWIQRAKLDDISVHAIDLQKPLIEGATRPSIKKAIDYLFNDPESPWSDVLARSNCSWLREFWESSLPNTVEFRKRALRALMDERTVGTIIFRPREDWLSRGAGQIELEGANLGLAHPDDDPDVPPPGERRSFRVCDVYAYFYSLYQHGPKFQLFWPEDQRNAGVASCRNWLSEK